MCGIYGFQVRKGQEISTHEATVLGLTLSYEMQFRGRDSFGGAIWPKTADESQAVEPEVIKGLGKVTEHGSDLLRRISEARALIGHTRQATTGATTVENTHPFKIGNILGVHNGIITNHFELNTNYDRDFDVDSQHIFAHLNENRDTKELSGYGAIAWTREDEEYKRIYIAKTNTGNLSVARYFRDRRATSDSVDHFCLVFASTFEATRMCAERIGVQWFPVNLKSGEVYMIQDGEIYHTDDKFELKEYSSSSYKSGSGKYFSNSHSSTSNNHSMTTYGPNARGKRKETKAERKAKKKAEAARALARQLAIYRDPTPENLRSKDSLSRCFIKNDAGIVVSMPLCPSCKCELNGHIDAYCTNNPQFSCKALINQPCYDTGLPLCADCHCFLVEGVHEVSQLGVIWCMECKNYCVPENGLIGDVEESEEVDEITENISPFPTQTSISTVDVVSPSTIHADKCACRKCIPHSDTCPCVLCEDWQNVRNRGKVSSITQALTIPTKTKGKDLDVLLQEAKLHESS